VTGRPYSIRIRKNTLVRVVTGGDGCARTARAAFRDYVVGIVPLEVSK
jgi:hypothetical protein